MTVCIHYCAKELLTRPLPFACTALQLCEALLGEVAYAVQRHVLSKPNTE
jgi:hypothetical protein